jgi:DNA-binding response OmpR family regulator
MPEKLRVLVVDDEPLQLELLERSLSLEGCEVCTTNASIGATALVRNFHPHVVLLDVNIPALPGHMLVEIVRKHAATETKLILYSACDETKLRELAASVKADGWLPKSVVGGDLVRRLRGIAGRPR